jgi:uncharacterized membrane protein (UPF0136 family)
LNVPTTQLIAAAAMAAYGLISIVGGILGFAKGSNVSLAAGGVAGILLLLCAIGVFRNFPVPSLIGAVLISLLLVGRFTIVLAQHRDDLGQHMGTTAGIVGIVMIVGGVLVLLLSGLALVTESRPPTLP